VVDDPDAIWKPGYDGPPPITASERGVDGSPAVPTQRGRRRRRIVVGVGLGVGLVFVLVAAAIAVGPLGSRDARPAVEAADPSVFGGPAARRLPREASTLWSVDIPVDGDHWVEVIRRDVVIAAVEDASAATPGTRITAFDASTGDPRWTLQLDAEPRDVTVVGAVDDVLVLEQQREPGSTVTGVDIETGEMRWSSDAEPTEGHVGVVGTPFIARLGSSSDRDVTLIDATSGRDVTDEATDVRPVTGNSSEGIVVDGWLVGVDDAGSITFEDDGANRTTTVTVSPEIPSSVLSLTPVSDSTFVVSAPGSISGVTVEDDTARVVWTRRDGVVTEHHPIVGGSLIQIATGGGSGIQLVDGLTGRTVEHLTMTPGVLQALVVAGDGAVVLRSSDDGVRLTGVDLDGTEQWSIAGSEPVVVGDRIAVRATSIVDAAVNGALPSRQLRLTAFGDDP
jgi:outer membrane protein assembly factor BamB